MSDTISERIKKGLEIRGIKQSELVEKTGIGKSSISTYISGQYEPKQRNIYKIAEALDVSEAWLMGLDVPMERVNSIRTLEITNDEFQLLSNYKKLNDSGKEKLMDYSNDLIETPKYLQGNNVTELITATKDNHQTLDNMYTTIAAHDDNLMNYEKETVDIKIMDTLKKRQK